MLSHEERFSLFSVPSRKDRDHLCCFGKIIILIQIPDSDYSENVYLPGSSVTILPGVIHRMSAIEDCEYLEASTPELSDVRISDDFQRD